MNPSSKLDIWYLVFQCQLMIPACWLHIMITLQSLCHIFFIFIFYATLTLRVSIWNIFLGCFFVLSATRVPWQLWYAWTLWLMSRDHLVTQKGWSGTNSVIVHVARVGILILKHQHEWKIARAHETCWHSHESTPEQELRWHCNVQCSRHQGMLRYIVQPSLESNQQ